MSFLADLFPKSEELRPLNPVDPASVPDATLAVSLLIPARNADHALENTVAECHRYLEARYGDDFEILVVTGKEQDKNQGKDHGHAQGQDDRTAEVGRALMARLPRLRVMTQPGPRGKGANLRAGFLASRGRRIFFTDADLPYDLSFFDDATLRLDQGYDFVTGNRRLPTSIFRVSVSLLKLAYGRHRLGLAFNKVVRRLFPIPTTDTQAGIKVMTREFAAQAFTRQRCPGFFFDLEVFLTASNLGFQRIELPVILHLNSEKSTVRVLRESLLAAFWLFSIYRANRDGAYGSPLAGTKRINVPALYSRDHLALSTRAFLRARWAFTPYSQIASALPPSGDILDLGCGHGFLAITAALGSRRRTVLGIDHDDKRVELAKHAAQAGGQRLANLKFEQGSLPELPPERRFSAITLIDVMHYFDPETQRGLVARAQESLLPGGRLLVREVDPSGGLISKWNRLYERLATMTGFTKASDKGLHFRTLEGWTGLFASAGFEVSSAPCSSRLFSDVLFVCEKTAPARAAAE